MTCPEQHKVDSHFARSISVADERSMREHLPGCASCRKRYERQLLLEQLDPAAAGPGPRLAHGLGLELAGSSPPANVRLLSRPQIGAIAGALALAACIALLYRSPKTDVDTSGFAARGGATQDATEVTVYRGASTANAIAVRAGASIQKGDELAFAYANPGGKRYLMIFGVDEHRHVYWYYPAWNDPAATPSSVPIEPTAVARPLPDAVRHGLDGTSLVVHAVFTDKPLDVHTVERLVGEARDERVVEGREPGAVERSIRFRVEP